MPGDSLPDRPRPAGASARPRRGRPNGHPRGPRSRRLRALVWVLVSAPVWVGIGALVLTLSGFPSAHHGSQDCGQVRSTVRCWLSQRPFYVAHRGGDADWVEGTAQAYRNAAGWNPNLALEVPVWRTADGVWVVSEDPDTTRVFGVAHDIRTSTWEQLSALRTVQGGYPMARLVQDILIPYGRSRVLFVDDKASQDVPEFLSLLDRYGGPEHIICKSYYTAAGFARAARQRGYLTWGYYYDRTMGDFAATEKSFDLLGLNYSAPAQDWAIMRATGKPVIGHITPTEAAARTALDEGAAGLMVSGVREVVPHA